MKYSTYKRKIAQRAYFCNHGTKKEWSSVVINIENIKKLKNAAKKVLVRPRRQIKCIFAIRGHRRSGLLV